MTRCDVFDTDISLQSPRSAGNLDNTGSARPRHRTNRPA